MLNRSVSIRLSYSISTCQICNQGEQQLKTLECQHVVCEDCLKTTPTTTTPTSCTEKCPCCSHVPDMGDAGAMVKVNNGSFLRKLFQLRRSTRNRDRVFKSFRSVSNQQKCTRCYRIDSKDSFTRFDSLNILCQKCTETHLKIRTLKRQLNSLALFSHKFGSINRGSSYAVPTMCAKHTDQLSSFFCESCGLAVCESCIDGKSKTHRCNVKRHNAINRSQDFIFKMLSDELLVDFAVVWR